MWENFFKHVDVLPENVCSSPPSTQFACHSHHRCIHHVSSFRLLIYMHRCISWTETLAMANPRHCRRSAGGNVPILPTEPAFAVFDGPVGMNSASKRTVASNFSLLASAMTVTLPSMNRVPTHAHQPFCTLCNVQHRSGSSLTSRTREKTLNQETIEANCRQAALRCIFTFHLTVLSQILRQRHQKGDAARACTPFAVGPLCPPFSFLNAVDMRALTCAEGAQEGTDCWRCHHHGCA